MPGWDFWAWLTYIFIAISALMPALGFAMTSEERIRLATARVIGSPAWKIIPAITLVISGLLVGANQLGYIGKKAERSQRLTEVQNALAAAIAGQDFTVPAGFKDSGKTIHLRRTAIAYLFRGTPSELQRQRADLDLMLEKSSDPLVQTLLSGHLFTIPTGYDYGGEEGAVTPIRLTAAAMRSGPCVDAPGSKGLHVDKETCNGHPKNFNLPNSENAHLKDVHTDDGAPKH